MNWLQNLPIRRKLTLVILLTCAVALLLACGLMAGYEWFDFRRMTVRTMTVLADVTAKNTQAALAFQDDSQAREVLKALEAEPYVEAACLYTPDGKRFAQFVTPGAPPFPAQPGIAGHHFEHGHLVVFRQVSLNGRTLGTICVVASLKGLYGSLQLFGWVSLLALFSASLLALLISSGLQRPISQPIVALAQIARDIAERKDYTVRARPRGRDETGLLTEAFNQMLGGIEQREIALSTANEALRGEITERKSAEGKVQAQLSRLQLLNQITRAIGERLDLKSVFAVVTKNLEDHLNVNFTCVFLYDQAGMFTVASVGVQSRAFAERLEMGEQTKIPVGENGLSQCVRGRLVYEPDTGSVALPFPQRLAQGGLRSLVLAPLLAESQVFGILLAAREAPERFNSGECEFLKQLSEHMALAIHQTQLYDALQRAYDDLRQTQQAVMQQERLRSLGQMASGIAHDINNAISPVALYTESLLEKEPNLSPRARGYLETIQRAIEDVAATVARMREFYRQREQQLTLAPVDLNRLVQQVVDLSRARWSDMPQQRGIMIKLALELPPELPAVMGVESEIREGLINLIFNAVDAMPEGGTLTLRTKVTEPAPARPNTPAVRHVSVEVADSGVGMDEDTRRRCLEPFFTTKGERGTGLGLAMVYGMARRNGAEIEIESAVGKGTTMRLIFTATDGLAAGTDRTAQVAGLPPRLRILMVDDDPLLIKSLRDILEGDGHVVVTANGGQAGIEAFQAALEQKEPFAVVITDLGMPYVDGRKMASAVKAASPATPVILLTGWGQRLVIEGDVPPHVDHVLNKPPKLRELREALAQCVLGKSD